MKGTQYRRLAREPRCALPATFISTTRWWCRTLKVLRTAPLAKHFKKPANNRLLSQGKHTCDFLWLDSSVRYNWGDHCGKVCHRHVFQPPAFCTQMLLCYIYAHTVYIIYLGVYIHRYDISMKIYIIYGTKYMLHIN